MSLMLTTLTPQCCQALLPSQVEVRMEIGTGYEATLCYGIAKELACILTPLTGQDGYTVKNAAEFVDKIRGVRTNTSAPHGEF